MSEPTKNYFTELYKVDVSGHVEKKAEFSYLSWPFAVAELRKRHPTATWEVVKSDGAPYLSTKAGHFVEVAVTVEGVRLSQIHPVLDHANRPIKEPTAFHINTSIQRCLVKAIALHGLGLFVYAGEDLPEADTEKKDNGSPGAIIFNELQPEVQDMLRKAAPQIDGAMPNVDRAISMIEMAVDNWPDADPAHVKTGLWSLLDSKTRSAIKSRMKESAT